MPVDVGALEDFAEGVPTPVLASGRQVGIVRWRDEVFAVRNICPHQLGPICGGHTMPLIEAGPNRSVRVDDDRLVIVCPWHSWEFDARSGASLWTDRFHLKTYPATVVDGRVLVDVGEAKTSEREEGAASGRRSRAFAAGRSTA